MGLRITTNTAAFAPQRALAENVAELAKRHRRLASGLRVGIAGDDAARLAMAERLRAQVRSVERGRRNAHDGIALLRTAEGALQEATEMVHRLTELHSRSKNGILSPAEQQAIGSEFNGIVEEINRIGAATAFGGRPVFGDPEPMRLHVGPGAGPLDVIEVAIDGFEATFTFETLGGGIATAGPGGPGAGGAGAGGVGGIGSVGGGPEPNGEHDGDPIEQLMITLLDLRGRLGAVEQRLVRVSDLLAGQASTATQALSRIVDADIARETAGQARAKILVDTGVAVLSQANAQPRLALALLQDRDGRPHNR